MSLLVKLLNKIYAKYLSFFYVSFSVDKNVIIDYRCEVYQKNNISIGKKSILYKYVTIYKDKQGQFSIGDGSHIAPYGYFLVADQKVIIGNNVAIAKNCAFFCSTNSIPENQSILFKDSYERGDITLGNNIFMGANCVVLPGTVIEDNVVIATNSTVKGYLEEGYLYGGNPVKKIKKVFE